MAHWLPIETAPKDGTRVLVYRLERVEVMSWDSNAYAKKPRPYWTAYDLRAISSLRAISPTHWMPLPDPPLSEAAAVVREGQD